MLALAQRLIGGVQLLAALRHPRLQADLGLTQLVFDQPSPLDFTGQGLVELFTAMLCSLQVFNQRLILKAAQQPVLNQAIDLPGNH